MTEAEAEKAWVYEETYTPKFLPALILFPPLLPVFYKYSVNVDDKKLFVGYSHYFNLEIDRSSIVKAEAIEYINGLTQWGGWGYRKNFQWQTGYITQNGGGISLTYKDKNEKETVVVFNAANPQKLAHILNTPVMNAVVH